MHIKYRGGRALLYRSTWIRKGVEGNSHGFSRQLFVGSMAVNAAAVPEDLRARMSSGELAFLHAKVIAPAREAAEAARLGEEQKKRDPLWRLEEAKRLITEAADLSAAALVPQGRVKSLVDALAAVQVLGSAGRLDAARSDPLADAVQSLRAAARAVDEGRYGTAPEEGVRKSRVYARWLEIAREVDGTGGEDGLLRVLQRTGWVKAKGR